METVEFCPICNNNSFEDSISLKDYFYTKESFTIQHCKKCGFKLTNPRPGKNEISRYYESENYLSHNENKVTLFSRAYGIVRSINIQNKARIIQKNSKGKSILDIGSGIGLLLNHMKKQGWETTGVEPGEQARTIAQKKYFLNVHENINNVLSQKYDVISLWHVLEHVFEIREYLTQIEHMLKEDGTLIIAVPNNLSLDSIKYKNYWAAYDVPRHLYHFRPKDIEELCRKTGFEVVKTTPMWFDAFYICILSEKYKGGSLQFIKAIGNAIISNLNALVNRNKCTSMIYIIKKNESKTSHF